MGPGQRENGIMVESSLRFSGRVAGIAGRTVIGITSDFFVLIICFGFVIMGMAVNACEYPVV